MVYNVNDHVAVASALSRDLNAVIFDIERGEEILQRLTAYPQDAVVGTEVLTFIKRYSSTCAEVDVSTEGSVVCTISTILDGLRRALIRMFEMLQELFRLIFDSQYRSRKIFLDLHRKLLAISGNAAAIQEFEQIQCTVISQKNILEVTDKNANLVNLIRFVAECTDNDAIDKLLNSFTGMAGVTWDNSMLSDSCEVITAERFVNFREAGWTFEGLEKAIAAHINSLSGIERLKDAKTKVEDDIRKLSKQVNSMMRDNVSIEMVKPLQLAIAIKMRVTKLVGAAIDILIKRSNAIANVLRAIHGEVVKIAARFGS